MALFENESIEDLEEEVNEYLDNPEKGIELIKSMLVTKKGGDEYVELDKLLSDKIFPILAELDLSNELEIYKMLIKIRDRVKEQKKIKLLAGKKVLGIGGKFSAGKSCFINSITNAELPVGQRPTTSIATYIVSEKKKKSIAISNNDNIIELDENALEALTHQFFDTYSIGFSKVIKNLVVYTPDFTYPNVVILDTPGYSKSDTEKRTDSSDAEMAREQLKSVDFLIWLIDSVQGVITQRDLEFISSLNINSEILVVFTKASMETSKNLIQKIETAKDALKSIDKKIYDVIAYDSMTKETLSGEGQLENFLSMVNDANIDSVDVVMQIKKIWVQLDKQITKQITSLKKQIKELEKVLTKSLNIEHISAVIKEYGRCNSALKQIEEKKKNLEESFENLIVFTKSVV